VAGLGEIGSPILKIISKNVPVVGYDLNKKLMAKNIAHWNKKYSYINEEERNHRLRSARNVSKSHPESVHHKVLDSYSQKLKQFNLQ